MYVYVKMPFSLNNVGATFQRVIDLDFTYIIDKFMVVYQDDSTTYSKKEID